jgi:hypothetical protein
MSCKSNCLKGLASIMLWAIASLTSAHADSPLEKNFWLSGPGYDGNLPPCDAALGRISEQFADTQRHFWANEVSIVGFERVREIAYSPWALGTIPRRFCTAVALVNDARAPDSPYRKHVVRYSIGEDTGSAGFDWGVEWCVTGYDFNWAYNPRCTMAGP